MNELLSNNADVFYVVKLGNREVSPRFTIKTVAEGVLANIKTNGNSDLKEDLRVVSIDNQGRELLFG